MDQIVRWLALSPERKKQYMAARTRTVDMTDLRHPAYRRFIDVTGPLGLRDKERALQFCVVRTAVLFLTALLLKTSNKGSLHNTEEQGLMRAGYEGTNTFDLGVW